MATVLRIVRDESETDFERNNRELFGFVDPQLRAVPDEQAQRKLVDIQEVSAREAIISLLQDENQTLQRNLREVELENEELRSRLQLAREMCSEPPPRRASSLSRTQF